MSTRFKTNSKKNYNQSPLVTGYEATAGAPDLYIPSCGIEDVDVSIFNLFDKEIVASCGGKDGAEIKKVPVIFAAGEKWAMLKNGRLIRDKNGTLIIPLITIMRTEINQNAGDDVVGRGINQQLGEIVVKRRLDKTDRSYQSLINRLLIPNQDNLSSIPSGESVSSDRNVGELSNTKLARDGAYLAQNRTNNIYETIVVPTPQFYTSKYQVTVWTQYMQHANQIMEKIFSSFLPQGQCWRLDTPKGYWFIARVEAGSISTETNFDDMSQQERYIKHTFNVDVPAYFFATEIPGGPVAIKRYVSSPNVTFDVADTNDSHDQPEDPYVLGSDDPTLPLDVHENTREDQRTPGWRRQKVYPVTQDPQGQDVASLEDPASSTLPRGQYVKAVSYNSKGETVYKGTTLDSLEIVITK
jgi:hypothetical protein